MSDTPETDLIWKDMNIGNYQPSWWFVAEKMRDHARRLERERDEAREQARQMSESNQVLMADVRFYRNAWEQLKEGAK